ncbi:MAG: glycosyltransferase 87 family protein, partial [Bacteroidota bacterium]
MEGVVLNRRSRWDWLPALLASLICYTLLAYRFQRYESFAVFTCLAVLFLLYAWVLMRGSLPNSTQVLVAAMVLRVVFLFSIPLLSDDVYRFLWDGWLWDHGYDPFLYTPREFMAQGVGEPQLFALLGNRDSHTVYPLIPMGLSRIAVHLSDDLTIRIVILRLAHLAAEFGTLMLMTNLFTRWHLPACSLSAYAFNPLVILELTGNLHHEAFVIFFLMAAISMLDRNRDVAAGALFAGAVASKLLPLIFLPAWLASLGRRRGFRFIAVAMVVAGVALSVQVSAGFVEGMGSGLGLYFNRFEFNASLWYLIREVGTLLSGYNIIRVAGPVMVLTGGLLIVFIALRKDIRNDVRDWRLNFFSSSLVSLTLYLIFATTVHPWYLAPMVALAAPAGLIFPLAWSGLAMFTYLGYHRTGFSENWYV